MLGQRKSHPDLFDVRFVDDRGRRVHLFIRRRTWLTYIATCVINDRTCFEIHGRDAGMLQTCLIREAWNGGLNHHESGDNLSMVLAE